MMHRIEHHDSLKVEDRKVSQPITAAAQEFFYDLTRFTLADMVRCGGMVRRLAADAPTMEEAAQAVTVYLYEHLLDKASNRRACVLVRLFKTHPYGGLSAELQSLAAAMAHGAALSTDSNCLTLLGSAGEEPQWNSRRTSKAHQCIPLLSEAMLEQFPMISQMIRQLGLTTAEVMRTSPELAAQLERRRFGVFHVPVALGSPFVPAQKDFVVPYNVQSVLGCSDVLPDGDIFVLMIFARVAITAATAQMFHTVALSLKLGLLTLAERPVFIDGAIPGER